VLRVDPLEGIIETCRTREAQLLGVIGGTVPAPPVAFVDGDGLYMGPPALITNFVRGVPNRAILRLAHRVWAS
jgi:hypothetical protein